MSHKQGNSQPAAPAEASPLSERVRALRLSNQMSAGSRRAWLPWALCGFFLITTAVFAMRSMQGAPAAAKSSTDGEERTADSKGVKLESKGNIIAAHPIQITPQVGGEIVWLDPNFNEGAVYHKYAPLARIDPVIWDAQLEGAKNLLAVANVNLQEVCENGSAQKEIETAKAQLTNLEAKLELSRTDERNKRQAGTGATRDEREKASIQLLVDQAAYDAQKKVIDRLEVALKERRLLAEAQVKKSTADVAQAKKQRDNCEIMAPVDGTILTKKAEEHGMVNALAFGAAGYLCEMADLTDLEVELFIQERDIASVRVGQQCRIVPDAHKKRTYTGYVSRIMPTADRAKGAIPVRVKLATLQLTKDGLALLEKEDKIPGVLLSRLQELKDREFDSEITLGAELKKFMDKDALASYRTTIVTRALKSSVPRDEEGEFLKPDMSVIVSFLE
jgi:multidrug resistance efflux pump